MPTVHLDEATLSQFTQQGTIRQCLRGFWVDGIESSIGAAAVMVAVPQMPGMPQLNDPHPADSNLRVIGYTYNGNSIDQVSGYVLYSTFIGGIPSSLTITTSTKIVNVQASILPDGTPVRISFDGIDGQPKVKKKFLTSTYYWPCSTVIVEGLNYGRSSFPAEGQEGKVNIYPFRGRPPGSWMIADFTTVYSVYQGITTYRCVLQGAPGSNKWWTTGILEDQFGKKVTYDNMDTDIKNAVASPYEKREVAPSGKGFSVHGAYDLVDFAALGIVPQGISL